MTQALVPPRGLALAHLTVEDASPLEAATAAARAGFRAVGLRISGFAPGEGRSIVGDAAQIRALRRFVSGEGLAVVNVCTYRLAPEIDPTAYRPVFDACGEIGASTVLATCFVGDQRAAADLLAAVADEAASFGIRIGLEFFRSSAMRNLVEAEALRIASDRSNVGHIVDALHLCRAGHVPADLAAINPALIYGVQVCDAPLFGPPDALLRAEIRNRLMPGDGELPLDALLAAVPNHLVVEVEAPHAAIAHLPAIERARRAYAAGRRLLAGPRRKPAGSAA